MYFSLLQAQLLLPLYLCRDILFMGVLCIESRSAWRLGNWVVDGAPLIKNFGGGLGSPALRYGIELSVYTFYTAELYVTFSYWQSLRNREGETPPGVGIPRAKLRDTELEYTVYYTAELYVTF